MKKLLIIILCLPLLLNAQNWTQIGPDIDGEAGSDYSGKSVSINDDGTRIAIGANQNGGTKGHVRVYENIGIYWNQLGNDIEGEASGDQSGFSVSFSNDGNTIAIGAVNNDGNGMNAGHVRVYNYNGTSWIQVGNDIDGEAVSDLSGWAVSLSSDGNTVAIGAPYNDGNSMADAGHVRVYHYDGTSWNQKGNDIDGEAAGDHSGTSVSLSSDGNTLAIGAPINGGNRGHVRIYNYNGTSWNQLGGDIDGEASNNWSGNSVSLSNDGKTVAIGAPNNNGNGANSGHVRIYNHNGTAWNQIGNDIDGEAAGDQSGFAVSLSSDGNTVAIGAPGNDGNGVNSGHARIYNYDGISWNQLGADVDGEAVIDLSAESLSLSSNGKTVIIGARNNNGPNGISSGHARVFDICRNSSIDVITACNTYSWIDGNTYTSSNNTATRIFTNTSGCDSIVALDLTVNYSSTSTDVQDACDSYTWIDGNTYLSSTNSATHTLTTVAGCDSLVTLDLTLIYSNSATDVQTACNTYTWIDGNTYTASNNTATYVLTNTAGCDSIVTLDLTIIYSSASTGTDVQSACDTYTWIDDNTYTTSNNTATYVLTNSAGCDSIITLDLTINNSSSTTDVQSACDTYTWIDGNTYTASNNTASQTLTNVAGCDSIVTLDLTINNSSSATDVQSACDSYTWIDGNTYTASNNTATHTLTNTAGCDSIITLDLTINNSNSATDVQTACNTYTWIDGNTYTASNNTATYVLTNTAGCDSTVTLDLTIIYSSASTGTDVQSACDTYTWIDGNTYTASNNTATYVLTNAAGCDSTITLDLTINNSSSTTDVQSACDTYTWIDGNIYTASNNTATYVLTNAAGCDSTITLDLTINNSSSTTDVQSACDTYTWIDGNTYTASNNTATQILTNAAGCDSIVTLNLTIHSINSDVSVSGSTLTSDAVGASYQWLDCNSFLDTISGETNQMFTATSGGSYAVEIMMNGCIDTSDCLEVIVVGVIENSLDALFNVFPNPTHNDFVIEFNSVQEQLKVELFSMSGQLMETKTVRDESRVTIGVEQSAGIYILVISDHYGGKAVFEMMKN